MSIEHATNDISAQAFINACALMCWPYIYKKKTTPIGLRKDCLAAQDYAKSMRLNIAWTKVIKYCPQDNTNYFATHRFESAVHDVMEMLKGKSRILADPLLSNKDVRFLRICSVYFRTESESSKKSLLDLVGTVTDPNVYQLFTIQDSSAAHTQKKLSAEIQEITSKFTGSASDNLSIEQRKHASEADPNLYKQFLQLRREYTKVAKNAITNITRKGGLVDVSDLTRTLDDMGIEYSIPKGFIGKMDEKNYYTIYGEKIDGTPVGDVRMNPLYKKGGSEYVLKCKAPNAQGWSLLYTVDAKKSSTAIKFQHVSDSIPLMEKARTTWRRDLMSTDPERMEHGVIMEILYLCAMRIGSPGNQTKGSKTFGLTTIQKRHCKLNGNKLVISYPGKDGVKQKHTIEPVDKYAKRVINYFRTILPDIDNDDDVFNLSARDINSYISVKLGLPIKAHKFRTMRGTLLMKQLLDEKEFNQSTQPKTIIDYFNKCALEVGKELGHFSVKQGMTQNVGTTAIKNYIDPNLMATYFKKYSVRPPATLETVLIKAGLME